MNFQPWYYFLSIERDFIRSIDFVHLNAANYKTFSNEYAKLLLLIGSEVDVVAKMLCGKIDPAKKSQNILDYQSVISSTFPGMHEIEIDIARFALQIKPWSTWGLVTPKPPSWWTAHNQVKHQRDKSFQEANQGNTLDALCGLMALLLYYYKDETHLHPYPELLDHGFPRYLVTERGKKLPGT